MSVEKVSVAIRAEIFVTNSAGVAVTGLSNSYFTKLLSKDGANDSTTITVTEIGLGRYTVTFTPASTGFYQLLIIDPTNNKFGWTEWYEVTTDGELTSAQITSAVPTVVQIRTEMDANSTKLANLDTTVSSRLATSGYTTPPTVVAIRTEIDSNSTQLAAILVAIASVATTLSTMAAATATAVWGFVVGSAYTAKRYLKAIGAAVAGKTSGGPTGFTARDLEDTQDQVTGTADSSGNRTPTSYGN